MIYKHQKCSYRHHHPTHRAHRGVGAAKKIAAMGRNSANIGGWRPPPPTLREPTRRAAAGRRQPQILKERDPCERQKVSDADIDCQMLNYGMLLETVATRWSRVPLRCIQSWLTFKVSGRRFFWPF